MSEFGDVDETLRMIQQRKQDRIQRRERLLSGNSSISKRGPPLEFGQFFNKSEEALNQVSEEESESEDPSVLTVTTPTVSPTSTSFSSRQAPSQSTPATSVCKESVQSKPLMTLERLEEVEHESLMDEDDETDEFEGAEINETGSMIVYPQYDQHSDISHQDPSSLSQNMDAASEVGSESSSVQSGRRTHHLIKLDREGKRFSYDAAELSTVTEGSEPAYSRATSYAPSVSPALSIAQSRSQSDFDSSEQGSVRQITNGNVAGSTSGGTWTTSDGNSLSTGYPSTVNTAPSYKPRAESMYSVTSTNASILAIEPPRGALSTIGSEEDSETESGILHHKLRTLKRTDSGSYIVPGYGKAAPDMALFLLRVQERDAKVKRGDADAWKGFARTGNESIYSFSVAPSNTPGDDDDTCTEDEEDEPPSIIPKKSVSSFQPPPQEYPPVELPNKRSHLNRSPSPTRKTSPEIEKRMMIFEGQNNGQNVFGDARKTPITSPKRPVPMSTFTPATAPARIPSPTRPLSPSKGKPLTIGDFAKAAFPPTPAQTSSASPFSTPTPTQDDPFKTHKPSRSVHEIAAEFSLGSTPATVHRDISPFKHNRSKSSASVRSTEATSVISESSKESKPASTLQAETPPLFEESARSEIGIVEFEDTLLCPPSGLSFSELKKVPQSSWTPSKFILTSQGFFEVFEDTLDLVWPISQLDSSFVVGEFEYIDSVNRDRCYILGVRFKNATEIMYGTDSRRVRIGVLMLLDNLAAEFRLHQSSNSRTTNSFKWPSHLTLAKNEIPQDTRHIEVISLGSSRPTSTNPSVSKESVSKDGQGQSVDGSWKDDPEHKRVMDHMQQQEAERQVTKARQEEEEKAKLQNALEKERKELEELKAAKEKERQELEAIAKARIMAGEPPGLPSLGTVDKESRKRDPVSFFSNTTESPAAISSKPPSVYRQSLKSRPGSSKLYDADRKKGDRDIIAGMVQDKTLIGLCGLYWGLVNRSIIHEEVIELLRRLQWMVVDHVRDQFEDGTQEFWQSMIDLCLTLEDAAFKNKPKASRALRPEERLHTAIYDTIMHITSIGIPVSQQGVAEARNALRKGLSQPKVISPDQLLHMKDIEDLVHNIIGYGGFDDEIKTVYDNDAASVTTRYAIHDQAEALEWKKLREMYDREAEALETGSAVSSNVTPSHIARERNHAAQSLEGNKTASVITKAPSQVRTAEPQASVASASASLSVKSQSTNTSQGRASPLFKQQIAPKKGSPSSILSKRLKTPEGLPSSPPTFPYPSLLEERPLRPETQKTLNTWMSVQPKPPPDYEMRMREAEAFGMDKEKAWKYAMQNWDGKNYNNKKWDSTSDGSVGSNAPFKQEVAVPKSPTPAKRAETAMDTMSLAPSKAGSEKPSSIRSSSGTSSNSRSDATVRQLPTPPTSNLVNTTDDVHKIVKSVLANMLRQDYVQASIGSKQDKIDDDIAHLTDMLDSTSARSGAAFQTLATSLIEIRTQMAALPNVLEERIAEHVSKVLASMPVVERGIPTSTDDMPRTPRSLRSYGAGPDDMSSVYSDDTDNHTLRAGRHGSRSGSSFDSESVASTRTGSSKTSKVSSFKLWDAASKRVKDDTSTISEAASIAASVRSEGDDPVTSLISSNPEFQKAIAALSDDEKDPVVMSLALFEILKTVKSMSEKKEQEPETKTIAESITSVTLGEEEKAELANIRSETEKLSELLESKDKSLEELKATIQHLVDKGLATEETLEKLKSHLDNPQATMMDPTISDEVKRMLGDVQVKVEDHVKDFRGQLTSEVKRTYGEIAKLRETKKTLQAEIADLMAFKVKHAGANSSASLPHGLAPSSASVRGGSIAGTIKQAPINAPRAAQPPMLASIPQGAPSVMGGLGLHSMGMGSSPYAPPPSMMGLSRSPYAASIAPSQAPSAFFAERPMR